MKLALFASLVVVSAINVVAQRTTPTDLTGTVMDQAGAVIVGVRVLLSDAKGTKFETVTIDDGSYRLKVPAGTYLLEAEYSLHKGWEPFKIEKYQIAPTNRMTLDICLRVDQHFIESRGTPVSEKKNKRESEDSRLSFILTK